jgi:hypothetical protein
MDAATASGLQPKRVEKAHLEIGSSPKTRTSKMVVLLVAAAGRGPAAAAAVLAWRLCQIWPGVPNLDWRLHLARKLELAISIGRNLVSIIIRQVRGLLY